MQGWFSMLKNCVILTSASPHRTAPHNYSCLTDSFAPGLSAESSSNSPVFSLTICDRAICVASAFMPAPDGVEHAPTLYSSQTSFSENFNVLPLILFSGRQCCTGLQFLSVHSPAMLSALSQIKRQICFAVASPAAIKISVQHEFPGIKSH